MDLYKLLAKSQNLTDEIKKTIEIQEDEEDDGLGLLRAKGFAFDEPEETKEQKEPVSITVEINNTVRTLGLKAHIKGYRYIQDAILMIVEDGTMINKITKKLYPTIARTYGTTPSRVERAIRHSIEMLWQTGDFSIINKLFGREVNLCEKKPTNSEFLATLADYISIRQEKNGR